MPLMNYVNKQILVRVLAKDRCLGPVMYPFCWLNSHPPSYLNLYSAASGMTE